MSTKHSAGPWKVDDRGAVLNVGPGVTPGMVAVLNAQGYPVAVVNETLECVDQAPANARLIAAAPELARLVEDLVDEADLFNFLKLKQRARALLADVRGEDAG